MQKTTVFRGVAALAALSFTLAGHAQPKPNNHQFLNVDEDSSVSPPRTYIHYKNDTSYHIVLSGGKVISISVNGHEVPADSFYVYDGLVERMKAQVERDKQQAVRDREQAVRNKAQAERDRQQAVRDKQQAERDAVRAAEDKRKAERDAEQASREKQKAERDGEQALQDKRQTEKDAGQALQDKRKFELDAAQAAKDKIQAEKDVQQAARDKVQAEKDKRQAEEDKALVKSLLAEVVKEGLAGDEKSITSLILDESVFYINGKKQSDELQKKFKEKFIKAPGYTVHYHNGMTNVGRMDR
jgi:hypothetical protein